MIEREADRLHEGLIRSFADLLPLIDGARLEERPGLRLVVCPPIPFPGFNGVWVDGPDSATAQDELRGAIEVVEGAGVPCWVEVRAGTTPSFEEAAQRLGFRLEEAIPGMVLRSDELVQGPSSTVEVTRVQDAPGLRLAASLAAEGFETPAEPFEALYTARVAEAPGLTIYVARAGGEAVSTATAWTGDGGVGIYNVATPPARRGHGYGRAVTQRAVQDGFAAGSDLAWLQASPPGAPVYRAMGFRQVATYLLFGRPTAG